MKEFLKIAVATLLFFLFAQSVFGQNYKQLDVLTIGTEQEVIDYLSLDSQNCFEKQGNVITSVNYFTREKVEIILEPRVITITTKNYTKEDLYKILLEETIYIASNKEAFVVNIFHNNYYPLKFQIIKQ